MSSMHISQRLHLPSAFARSYCTKYTNMVNLKPLRILMALAAAFIFVQASMGSYDLDTTSVQGKCEYILTPRRI